MSGINQQDNTAEIKGISSLPWEGYTLGGASCACVISTRLESCECMWRQLMQVSDAFYDTQLSSGEHPGTNGSLHSFHCSESLSLFRDYILLVYLLVYANAYTLALHAFKCTQCMTHSWMTVVRGRYNSSAGITNHSNLNT